MAKWRLAGLVLVGLHLALVAISPFFSYERSLPLALTAVAVGLFVLAGLAWLAAIVQTERLSPSGSLLAWLIGVGVALRAITLFSTPILETDFYRYLWDGGVAAHGFNPYAWSPKDALAPKTEGTAAPAPLRALARDASPVVERVNHPELRTIYPPVGQAFFALAHWLGPWSLAAWRLVALGLDAASLLILIALLRTLRLPLAWLAVYWWNPLVVKELFNSAHADVVVVPFVLGAVLLAIRGRTLPAALSLALATGAKVWPVILLPLVLRPVLRSPGRLLAALGLFAVVVAGLFVPVYVGGLDEGSGFVAYSRLWEMNDAFFMLFLWAARAIGQGQGLARAAVAALVGLWALALARTKPRDGADFCGRALLVAAAAFLLSPTQFPWYYVWMVPLLAVRPRLSLLLYTVLLPLYYLRFYFIAVGYVDVFDYGIVWVENVPVAALLAWEWWRARGRAPAPLSEAPA